MTIDIQPAVRLFGLSGSLRRNSYCRSVLEALQAILPPDVRLALHEPRLPLYSEDEDGEASPHEVRRFRASIAASDGVVIVTPEYNHSLPGALKNALDWASRPLGAAALTGKPVVVISVSPAFTGGVRAQSHLHDVLLAIRARIVAGPQIVIGNIAAKISDGRFVDESSLCFALETIGALLKDVGRGAPAAAAASSHVLEEGAV
ncbi:NAD(P)H-dependent FMN reductase [Enhydrobacter aerosaccus]|uniref:NAD(P)H-dependent FMN reductase n=1 Tax=Enhydrobacter aerosaccus TaxID=225324 RepID=A0A1T4THX5_9HYPH|nr:NAD(P)H-dependent oxidoreductase [Enhydrobacter aerosaccus]SKA39908.1 NAD(P)H-dependent FMN reductase [Enhydrobacter aerosaccus]